MRVFLWSVLGMMAPWPTRTADGDGFYTEQEMIELGKVGQTPMYPYSQVFRDSNGLEGSLFQGDVMLSRDLALRLLGEESTTFLEDQGFVFLNVSESSTSSSTTTTITTTTTEQTNNNNNDNNDDNDDDNNDNNDNDNDRNLGVSATAVENGLNLWTQRTVDGKLLVPYTLVEGDFTVTQKDIVRKGLQMVEESSGVVKFVNRTTEVEYIQIGGGNSKPGCFSNYIGMLPGAFTNYVNIGLGCFWPGIVAHELLHTLGFFHEHSRIDRDDYVSIELEHVIMGRESNFATADTVSLESDYDFDSVMHYFLTAFSANGNNTINVLPGVNVSDGVIFVGQRSRLSYEDTQQLVYLYQCSTGPRNASDFEAAPCTPDCRCWEGALAQCNVDMDCQGELVCAMDPVTPPPGCTDVDTLYDGIGVSNRTCAEEPNACTFDFFTDFCRNHCGRECPPQPSNVTVPTRMCLPQTCDTDDDCPDVCLGGRCAVLPSAMPSQAPSVGPSATPSRIPSSEPSQIPSILPSQTPTFLPSTTPSEMPSQTPTVSLTPTAAPILSEMPSARPSQDCIGSLMEGDDLYLIRQRGAPLTNSGELDDSYYYLYMRGYLHCRVLASSTVLLPDNHHHRERYLFKVLTTNSNGFGTIQLRHASTNRLLGLTSHNHHHPERLRARLRHRRAVNWILVPLDKCSGFRLQKEGSENEFMLVVTGDDDDDDAADVDSFVVIVQKFDKPEDAPTFEFVPLQQGTNAARAIVYIPPE